MKHTTCPVTVQLKITEVEALEAEAAAQKISRAALIKNMLRKQMAATLTVKNTEVAAVNTAGASDVNRVVITIPVTPSPSGDTENAIMSLQEQGGV